MEYSACSCAGQLEKVKLGRVGATFEGGCLLTRGELQQIYATIAIYIRERVVGYAIKDLLQLLLLQPVDQ